MRLFSAVEAKHYCSRFGRSVGDSEESIYEFQKTHLITKHRTLSEGTPIFDEYRDCLLRDVERNLFLSASHYRRSLDLMISSASPWTHVTLYYGSGYAAHALLGIFGCTIIKKCVIDVEKGQLGNQSLRIRRMGNGLGQVTSTYSGSHEKFWDLFYQAFQSIIMVIPLIYQSAVAPIGGNPIWQIENRNNINYDSFTGIKLAEAFERDFTSTHFPVCLPGVMNKQFKVLELLLEMSFYYAQVFGLVTDALDKLRTPLPLRTKVRELIYNEKPLGLVKKSKKSKVT